MIEAPPNLPGQDAGWDAEVSACPGATFFHSAAWARTLVDAYGFRPVYFTDRCDGRLRALLPLLEVDSWLTGRRGVGLPFTDECPPIATAPEALPGLCREALAHGRWRGWRYLEIRGGREHFGAAPASDAFFGHRLDLSAGEAKLFGQCDSGTRRAVRKAERGGLQIEFAQSPESIRDFHRLLQLTRQRHGVPPQPFHFFASIQRHILAANRGWVVLARRQGVPIAGAVFFRFGRTAIYKYGASDLAFQELRANNLVMWEAIRRHAAEGFATLDFGRTDLANDGLRKFKLSWGATERRVEYVRHDRRIGSFIGAPDRDGAWSTAVFRRLPRPLLRAVGAAFYKHAA